MEAVKLGYPPFPHCADLGLIGRHFDTMNSNDISYDGVKVEDIIEVGNNIWKYSWAADIREKKVCSPLNQISLLASVMWPLRFL